MNVNTSNYQLLSNNISGILIVEVDSNTKKGNKSNKQKQNTQKIIIIKNEKNKSDKK